MLTWSSLVSLLNAACTASARYVSRLCGSHRGATQLLVLQAIRSANFADHLEVIAKAKVCCCACCCMQRRLCADTHAAFCRCRS